MDSEASKKIETFFQKFRFQEFQRGQIIINPISPPLGLLYLQSGTVRQYTISPQGDEITLNTFRSPSLFPVAWVINDSQNEYYFEASSKVKVWIAPRHDALVFFRNNPEVMYDLLQRIYRGLGGYFKRMESLIGGTAKSRVIVHLLIHTRRFGNQKIKITEGELASQAGLSRETVSRQIRILKEKGLVSFEKRTLIIPSLEKLENELEFSTM